MTESDKAVAKALPLLRDFEGLRLTAYRDIGGYWTAGYGHRLTMDEAMAGAAKISTAQAEKWLKEDAEKIAAAVAAAVRLPLTINQRAALISLGFNIGPTALEGSTLVLRLNEGKVAEAAQEFPRWCHVGKAVVGGLSRRRAAERELFMTPDEAAGGELLQEIQEYREPASGPVQIAPAPQVEQRQAKAGGVADWAVSRAKEPSTWRGLGLLLAAAGFMAPGTVEVLVSAGLALASVVEVARNEGAKP